jgi:Lsr2
VRKEALVAQKIQVLLVDDLDGSAADGTVRFGLDGTEYEIDLTAEHAQALRGCAVALRAGGAAAGGAPPSARPGQAPAGGRGG